MADMPTPRTQVFISYSHADEEYLLRLRKHLAQLERRNIRVWTDKDIEPGDAWLDAIRSALAATRVAVLMISADFLDSPFIANDELPPLLDAARDDGVRILPVIVKPSAFGQLDLVPISRYQAVNMTRPLAMLDKDTEREAEYQSILKAIRKSMEGEAAALPLAPEPALAGAAAPQAGVAPPGDGAAGTADGGMAADLAADLAQMARAPGRQELVIHVAGDVEDFGLMFFTEGRDRSVLWEVAGTHELPLELQPTSTAHHLLTGELGFQPPDVPGGRYWRALPAAALDTGGSALDVDRLSRDAVDTLRRVFGLPSPAVGISWTVYSR